MSFLQMSISAGVMIGIIIMIRALAINRLPKKMFLVLWRIVLLRLLLPFSWPSPFSFYSLVNRQWAGEIGDTPAAATFPVVPTVNTLPTAANAIPAAGIPLWTWIWGIGAILCTLYFAIAYIRCHRGFRTSMPVENSFTAEWLSAHKCRRSISIRQTSGITAPLTYGIFRPVILMPIHIDWADTKKVQYVLTHEYIHIRCLDGAFKLVLAFALCIHWFNPLVWVMYILANRDVELSCDKAVVQSFGENSKSAYALALISMEEQKSGLVPFCNSFSKNAIEERITSIMKTKKNSLLGFLAAMLLVVGVTTFFATSATAESSLDAHTDSKAIDLAAAKSFRVTAGSGPEQAYDYSELKETYFILAQDQKLQVDVDYITAFHTDAGGNSIKLIFMDSHQHTVELIVKEGESGEVISDNAGVYSLSIQNDEPNSLYYSFILK